MLSSQPVLTVGMNILKILDGTQTFDKVDNPALWDYFQLDNIPNLDDKNGPLPDLRDRVLKMPNSTG